MCEFLSMYSVDVKILASTKRISQVCPWLDTIVQRDMAFFISIHWGQSKFVGIVTRHILDHIFFIYLMFSEI